MYQSQSADGKRELLLGWALRETFKDGYRWDDLRADVLAGLVVAVVALPLGMALSVASSVHPVNGLYTVIFAGVIAALLGGSRVQVSGPTAAFVVLLVPVVARFGVTGLLLAGFLSGIIMILLGVFRLGSLIQFIPHPVTTGFTSGIALVIAVIQLKDFFGLKILTEPDNFIERLYFIGHFSPTMNFADLAIGIACLLLLVICARNFKRTPAPIVALFGVTVGTVIVHHFFPHINFATLGARFPGGIPQKMPEFHLPWQVSAGFLPNWSMVSAILPSAVSIAALGAIESLLSAQVAAGFSRKSFNPNSELVGIGVANLVCPFFGGIPATGAIARTTTNFRFGARSPIAAVVHGVVVLVVILTLAPFANYLPMAGLAALMLFVAYNMAEKHNFVNILRFGSKEDRWVLLTCFGLTIFFDMTVGVGVGMILACLLFIRAAADMTFVKEMVGTPDSPTAPPLPKEFYVFEINGWLFFGAAYKAVRAVSRVSNDVRIIILDMSKVHMVDVTGLAALRSAVETLLSRHKKIVFVVQNANVRKQIHEFIKPAVKAEHCFWASKLDEAVEIGKNNLS